MHVALSYQKVRAKHCTFDLFADDFIDDHVCYTIQMYYGFNCYNLSHLKFINHIDIIYVVYLHHSMTTSHDPQYIVAVFGQRLHSLITYCF